MQSFKVLRTPVTKKEGLCVEELSLKYLNSLKMMTAHSTRLSFLKIQLKHLASPFKMVPHNSEKEIKMCFTSLKQLGLNIE